jgi:hypothetical protein
MCSKTSWNSSIITIIITDDDHCSNKWEKILNFPPPLLHFQAHLSCFLWYRKSGFSHSDECQFVSMSYPWIQEVLSPGMTFKKKRSFAHCRRYLQIGNALKSLILTQESWQKFPWDLMLPLWKLHDRGHWMSQSLLVLSVKSVNDLHNSSVYLGSWKIISGLAKLSSSDDDFPLWKCVCHL